MSRSLTSTCYDGHVISTPFEGKRYMGPEQRAQADQHRERVRAYLAANGLGRLKAPETARAA